MGVRVEIQPITTRHNDLNEVEVGQLRCLTRKLGKDAIRIDSIIPSFSEMSGSKSYRILYTTVESPTIPKQTVDICNAYDEVWVTSDFCRDALRAGGVKRDMLVVPSSTNTALYREDIEPHPFRPPLKPFVFASVFGWSYRKGYDALLKAYLKEFNGDDPVSLLIVSRYQYSSDSSKHVKGEVERFIKTYGGSNPAHIARCNRVIPEHIMPNIYKAANVFVLPSRGEGFGLPYCEASMCGLPVIATNHSGQTMFLNNDNSYLVNIDRLVKMQPGQMHVHYWDNQLFPDLTSDDFISRLGKTMRHVYENYDEAKIKNKNLQETIVKDLSCIAAAKKAKERIDEIWTSKRRSR
jgi:glycosyltransferase involved in cell wall biosynthesis